MKGHLYSGYDFDEHSTPYFLRKLEGTGRLVLRTSCCNALTQPLFTEGSIYNELAECFLNWVGQVRDVQPEVQASFFVAGPQGEIAHMHNVGIEEDRGETYRLPAADHLFQPLTNACLAEEAAAGAVLSAEEGQEPLPVAYALPFFSENGKLILVLGSVAGNNETVAKLRAFPDWAASFIPFIYYQMEKKANAMLAGLQKQLMTETRKRENLLQVVQELHSIIDTDVVLAEIVSRMRQFYPDAQVDLFMTQDYRCTTVSVKPLRFMQGEDDLSTKAFIEGQLVIGKGKQDGEYEMAVPLSGKQGVYGVLFLHGIKSHYETGDIQLIKAFAGSAGEAFEKAKLYEQSNLLVNELRLINELTKRLNRSLRLSEIYNFASTELLNIFRADYCCILDFNKETNEFVVRASNLPEIYNESFASDYGFSGIVRNSKEPVIISDYKAKPSVKSKLMDLTGSRSLIASPIVVNGEAQGVILVAHRYPSYFSYDNYKLLQVLAGHIGLALVNAVLHAEVKRMVITDNLTKLYARHYLDEQVGKLQKKDFCGSLIVVDIDNFKQVNDTYGHQAGDKTLIQVSQVIKTSIRLGDIPARWGGEELAIYLPQVTTDQAVQVAERIRSRVSNETDPKVTVSCGVSQWNWQDEKISVESLFYRSDMALYKAKHEGKNRIRTG